MDSDRRAAAAPAPPDVASPQEAAAASPSYSLPGFPEFYEHLLSSLPPEYEPGLDISCVCLPLLKAALPSKAASAPDADASQPTTVLDLCTGSGRVLLGLLKQLADHSGAQVPHLRLVGIDSSEEMLAAACAAAAAARIPPRCDVSWHCADAAGLPAPELARLRLQGACRLIVCAAGSFHHLLSADAQLACMRSIAAALAPAGPAYAVLNIFCPEHLQAVPDETAVLGPFRRTCVQQQAEQATDGGRVWRQRFELERFASGTSAAANDAGQRLWQRQEQWALREVSPADLRRLAAAAGLQVVRQQALWADGWGDGTAARCADSDARIFTLSLSTAAGCCSS